MGEKCRTALWSPAATIDSCQEVPARAQERRLDRDLQLALRHARLDQPHELGEAGPCGGLGHTHPLQLHVVLRPPHADQLVAQLLVRVGRGAEPPHGAPAQPLLQLVHRARSLRHALAVALEPGPEELLSRHRCTNSIHPSPGS